ncbi:MAG: hypothetical protein ACPLTR_05450 [Thermacetogeniaceae bacterium]
MTAKRSGEEIRLRRIPERGELFDLFRQVAEKIRREKSCAKRCQRGGL